MFCQAWVAGWCSSCVLQLGFPAVDGAIARVRRRAWRFVRLARKTTELAIDLRYVSIALNALRSTVLALCRIVAELPNNDTHLKWTILIMASLSTELRVRALVIEPLFPEPEQSLILECENSK